MTHRNTDWYEHLVEQSRTDHIYDLIHGYPLHDWAPNHDFDFVALRLRHLPEKMSGAVPVQDISKELSKDKWCFPGDDYVLLDSYKLTEYLEAARRFIVVEDFEGREFIELLFTYPQRRSQPDEGEGRYIGPNHTETTPDTIANKEDSLGISYELLRTGTERELALAYAKVGEQFLDEKRVAIGDNVDLGLWELKRVQLGYNIVAMVYAWNNKIDDAARVDKHYLIFPHLWEELQPQIHPYLEMLMAKQQGDYLEHLFGDRGFRQRFLAHFEAYVSLLVNDRYELTRLSEVVGIINRVNNARRTYR